VHFRVWAPDWKRVEVALEPHTAGSQSSAPLLIPMTAEAGGYFSAYAAEARVGDRYRYHLDGKGSFPDPASRRQPEGPHGPSEIVDPADYQWHDSGWQGVSLPTQIIYEMHVGTFTPEGTFVAAAAQLGALASLGITVVEIMPVNEFDGQFGWGYDGVDLFAPTRLYGAPNDLRHFVDEAHRQGLAVLLDVVYNHFGPNGNYATSFAKAFHSEKHQTEWGGAINFDGEQSQSVREFFVANAGYWIDEFHMDGLRIDAIQAIVDDSPEHVLAAIARRVREAAHGRKTLVVGENEFQQARLVRSPADSGYGLDAVWNDDFHHALRVAATGHNEFYYGDYQGTPQELISAVKWGYLYQGQWNARQGRQRGTPVWDLAGMRFISFLQNHDQIANSAQGLRMHLLTSPGRYRALTALFLLAPGTPMLFQGQEFAASAPFLYFADHQVDLAKLVREGRQEFLRQFHSLGGPASGAHLADPCDRGTFERCKLDFSERQKHADVWILHRDLIRLRREDPVFSAQRADRIHGAVIGPEALLLRYFGDRRDDRLLIVNLGRDLLWSPVAEPLASPPSEKDWRLLWSSEDPRYGGSGTGLLDTRQWRIPGHTTIVLRPEKHDE
jgi:maltooligosyltrehalose trehalohydrolase